ADFDVCSYLQLCQNHRTDLTLIPIGNIDRPWYVHFFLKDGLPGAVRNIHFSLTNDQIDDIHPFKWDTTLVTLPVDATVLQYYGLQPNHQFNLMVAPDLTSERLHSKMGGEKPKKRTYLSPQRAILIQIVEDNFSRRPIYFSNFASPDFFGGLDRYFQDCGLVSKLLPFKTTETSFAFDFDKMKQLTDAQNLAHYQSLLTHNMPRISGIATQGYIRIFNALMNHYYLTNNSEAAHELIRCFDSHINIGLDKETENQARLLLQAIENRIK
ncbi:MAG: hypothetical protein PHU33_15365, partial [Bacteroidales bacterium]|nr:hypothetical protein [Bacteroidales bacterium]